MDQKEYLTGSADSSVNTDFQQRLDNQAYNKAAGVNVTDLLVKVAAYEEALKEIRSHIHECGCKEVVSGRVLERFKGG